MSASSCKASAASCSLTLCLLLLAYSVFELNAQMSLVRRQDRPAGIDLERHFRNRRLKHEPLDQRLPSSRRCTITGQSPRSPRRSIFRGAGIGEDRSLGKRDRPDRVIRGPDSGHRPDSRAVLERDRSQRQSRVPAGSLDSSRSTGLPSQHDRAGPLAQVFVPSKLSQRFLPVAGSRRISVRAVVQHQQRLGTRPAAAADRWWAAVLALLVDPRGLAVVRSNRLTVRRSETRTTEFSSIGRGGRSRCSFSAKRGVD